MLFTKEEWKSFRSIETLTQKAGIERDLLPMLVVKELIDNSLDVSNICKVGFADFNTIYVEDDGPGIDPQLLASFFSINRPMISSKLLRLPTRGALGNGLRVVMGAVISTNGSIRVGTRGKFYRLEPQLDGTTIAIEEDGYEGVGTRVLLELGLPVQGKTLAWAKSAIALATGEDYKGKSSAHWYSSESFYELINAANTDLKTLLSYLHGVGRKLSKEILDIFNNLQTREINFEDSEKLLSYLRTNTLEVNPQKLGFAGGNEFSRGEVYQKRCGFFKMRSTKGLFDANIPFVVEVWTKLAEQKESTLSVNVNKTPIVAEISCWTEGGKTTYWGNGFLLKHRAKPTNTVVNIITPYMPITSDGKAPDFHYMRDEINKSIKAAVKKVLKYNALVHQGEAKNEKEIIIENLESAIEKTSGNGLYKFSQRQLYYTIRPYVSSILDKELDYNYFCRVITEYEADNGMINGLYRDPRGILYHPHLQEEIPVGTLSIEEYNRPAWTFNKILYSEKEGFFQILRDAKFPERFDCALLTSKGYASRAVKDLFDLLGETDEEILFFCIHDSDSAGTKIYETLQEATLARAARKVKVINLGLDPWEAVKMGLEVETFENKAKRPVAEYVIKHYWETPDDDTNWEEWLQTHRVELNAMTSPQFLEWLETSIAKYNFGKLIPRARVMERALQNEVETRLKETLVAKILNESGYEQRLEAAVMELTPVIERQQLTLRETVADELDLNQSFHWTMPIKEIAKRIVI